MSWLTVAWSMCAAAGAMVALMHLVMWFDDRRSLASLLSLLMAASAAALAMIELHLVRADSIVAYGSLVRWENVAIFALLVAMVWLVRARLPTARRSLAVLVTALWCVGLIFNFLSPSSLTFIEITALKHGTTFWGEPFVIGEGVLNPWRHVTDLASVLILIYVADASIRARKSGIRRRARLIGGSIIFFMVTAGFHTPLVDAGVIATPYMISFAFLAILLAMSYDIVADAVAASRYAREVAARERRWNALMDNVQLAVIGVDPGGRINYANPFLQRLIGFGENELVGRPMTSLLPQSDVAELERRLDQAAVTGPRPHSEWALVGATGEQRTLTWSSVRLLDRDENFAGVLSVGADITESLKAQSDLNSARREMERLTRVTMLGELASALAHELNQPLAAILSNAQAARRFMASDAPDLDEVREILDDIIRDDKRAGEVIHGLRAMLRKGEIVQETFEIDAAIQKVLGLVNGELSDQNIALHIEHTPNLPPVRAGRVEIEQVITNLILNGANAMNDTPADQREIAVQTALRGDDILVAVEDHGAGIAPQDLPRLFDPFFTTRSGGVGMGLAICRRIVEAHGGRIWAANNPTGGATFSFLLPTAQAQQAVANG